MSTAVRELFLQEYECITFMGKRSQDNDERFEIRRVAMTDGIDAIVVNGCYPTRNVECHILLPKGYPSRRTTMPCVSIKHTTYDTTGTPEFDANLYIDQNDVRELVPERIADLCALPTWLQLSCNGFTLPEMEQYWDVIPVMTAVVVRCAMNAMFIHDKNHIGLMLLADEFDQKYDRFSSNERLAIDQLTPTHNTDSHQYCMAIGGYVLEAFFGNAAYTSSNIWQSVINPSGEKTTLTFDVNKSAVRSKIICWLCNIEDDLRYGGKHRSTIRQRAHLFMLHTYQIFNFVKTINLGYSTPCEGGGDGGDGSAPTQN